jgi:hypothetical protein
MLGHSIPSSKTEVLLLVLVQMVSEVMTFVV